MLAGYCSENTLVGMLQVYGPKLEELFSTSHFFLPCSLQKVFDHCPNLKKIGLNERLVSLSPSVEEVVTHLSMAHPLDDVNLLHAAPNLKRIKVTLWCLTVGNIRNNGHVLLQLPEVVPSLEALKVCTGECSNLIDQLLYEILENIVQRAPSLRVVEMEPRRPHFHFQFQGDRGNI
ncbi:Hypothetical predicted protein [Cloeon dipterum]|uniref:F-box domain-containing protein n=1 Tax=Cloeon dipterum TaxID=197152 RepID=A0A8S1DE10_9INSE|nr:Hypothetical predicted protein [Cloeon dipterum]